MKEIALSKSVAALGRESLIEINWARVILFGGLNSLFDLIRLPLLLKAFPLLLIFLSGGVRFVNLDALPIVGKVAVPAP